MIRCSFLVSSCCVVLLAFADGASAGIPGYPDEGHWYHSPTTTMEHWASGPESIVVYGDGSALVVADVSTPSAMTTLGELNTGYIVGIIDISDPMNPTTAAVWSTSPTSANGVWVHNDVMYVAADRFWGLFVVDISDPTIPDLIDIIDTPGTALKVTATDDLVALADGAAGVRIWGTVTVEPPLFADGFELGNANGWSSSLP